MAGGFKIISGGGERVPRIKDSIEIEAPVERVYAFCTNVTNLPDLFPKGISVDLVDVPEQPLREGARIGLRFHRAGIAYPWESVITACDPCKVFEDVLTRGPMKRWVSRHYFEATPRGTRVTHVIDYEIHFGMLGMLCALLAADPLLRRIFGHVHRATKDAIEAGTIRG